MHCAKAHKAFGILAIAPSIALRLFAQGSPEVYRTLNNDLANNAVSAVEVFSAGKMVSTGSFEYDNPTLPDIQFQTYKLPGSHYFGESTNTVRPFIEGYLGYFKLDQDISLTDPTWGSLDVKSGTITAGPGVDYGATDWLTLTPRLQFAYSHVEMQLRGNPPPPLDSILASWRADALTILPSMEVNFHHRWGCWDVALDSQYTYLRVVGIDDTSPIIKLDSDTQLWRNEISTRFYSPWKTLGLPLDFGALFARHDVTGQIRQSDLLNYFYEARLSLYGKLPEKFHPITEITLSGAYYFHGPLTGYSIGISLGF